MKVQEILTTLSTCHIGAVILSTRNQTVLAANLAAEQLLHLENQLVGRPFPKTCHDLLTAPGDHPPFASAVFGEYLLPIDGPMPDDLPVHSKIVFFRDATADYYNIMMKSALNHVDESLVMCDADAKLTMVNNQALILDSFVLDQIYGKDIEAIYTVFDNKTCMLPEVLKTQKPKTSHRQAYTTHTGKQVDSVANFYPVIYNKQLLGAVSIEQNWHEISALHKKILDLQDALKDAQSHKGSDKTSRTPSALGAKYTFDDIIYGCSAMHRVIEQCKQVAATDAPVMIYGETGTGKELIAQSLHNASQRANGPFLAINCAALPESLLESLLFGSVKGAYTGAESRPGLFEQADHGTLLLDEINSMDISLQSKLLRVLQDHVIRRIGSQTEKRVDVRVLSCINIPPMEAVAENKLRMDLYYRLGVVNIELPPLKDRQNDVELLTHNFIHTYNKKLDKDIQGIDDETKAFFYQYDWPGNVRELQHTIEHAMILTPDGVSQISPTYLPPHLLSNYADQKTRRGRLTTAGTAGGEAPNRDLSGRLKDYEKETILEALEQYHGNITRSAKFLHMSRQNLQYRIKRYNIDLTPFRNSK